MSTVFVFALALLAASPGAQSKSSSSAGTRFPSGRTARYDRPIQAASIDLATGEITRGSVVTDRAGSTTVSFDNLDLSGFSTAGPGNLVTEWADAAVKGTYAGITASNCPGSQLWHSFTFAYCSAILDVNSGGPGGSVLLDFYSGYSPGGPLPPVPLQTVMLSGLPGNTSSGSFFSNAYRCYTFQVVLPELVSFPDGPIGYSWRFLDVGTDGFAGTWPMLSCVRSCTTFVPPSDGQGMVDSIDEYTPLGTFSSSIAPGTSNDSSISMQITEAGPVLATISSCCGIPAALDTLTSTPAIVGAPWTATVTSGLDRTSSASWTLFFGNGGISKPTGFLISQIPSPGNNFGTSKSGRRLLCTINTQSNPSVCTSVGIAGPAGSMSMCQIQKIPSKINLIGANWCGQAVVVGNVASGLIGGGNRRLTCALFGVVGTTP